MEQWISFGGASGLDAWEFGWNALAAIGALVASGVALFVHFHQQRFNRNADTARRRVRTVAVAPQLAADVMRVNWAIAQGLREIMVAHRLPLADRTKALLEAWERKYLTIDVVPGDSVHTSDIDWLEEPVRQCLAELKAQISVSNAMWNRLLAQTVEPFQSREEGVGAMLKDTASQMLATNLSCMRLIAAMRPHLPPSLLKLLESFEREHKNFAAIVEAVPMVPRVKRPHARQEG